MTFPRDCLDFVGCTSRAEAAQRLRDFFNTVWDDAERKLQTDVLLDVEAADDGLDIDDLDAILASSRERKSASIDRAVRQLETILDRLDLKS